MRTLGILSLVGMLFTASTANAFPIAISMAVGSLNALVMTYVGTDQFFGAADLQTAVIDTYNDPQTAAINGLEQWEPSLHGDFIDG